MEKAHKNPRVLALWQRYAEVYDIMPLKTLEEAEQMFAGFKPLEL